MSPEIAAKIHEIRAALVRGDLSQEEELKLVAEGVAMYRDARGIVMKAVEEKKARPKAAKAKKPSGDDLLDQIIGASNE